MAKRKKIRVYNFLLSERLGTPYVKATSLKEAYKLTKKWYDKLPPKVKGRIGIVTTRYTIGPTTQVRSEWRSGKEIKPNPFIHAQNPNIKEQVINLWGRGYSLAQIQKKLNITIDMLDKDLSRLPQAIQSGKFTTRPGYTPPYYQINPSKKKNPVYFWGFDYSGFPPGKVWRKFLKTHKFYDIGAQLKAGFETAEKRGEDIRHYHWLNKDGVYMITEHSGLVPPAFAAYLGYVGLAAPNKRALLKVVEDFNKKAEFIKAQSPWSRDFI